MNEERNEKIKEYTKNILEADFATSGSIPIWTSLLNAELGLELSDRIFVLTKDIELLSLNIKSALGSSTQQMIDSNESLAKSNDKHSRAMIYLTVALMVVACAQAIFTYGQYIAAANSLEPQREANSIENAKWQYERSRDERIELRDAEWRKQDLEKK